MNTNEILKFIEQTIHSVIIATVDDNGLPITCAIDIMDSDEKGLYFLTAKGKGFYDRLLSTLDVPKIGICYDFQLKDQIPAEPFDRKMDLIITEKEIL